MPGNPPATDVNAFVSSFSRNRQAAAPAVAPGAADFPPAIETTMQAVPTPEAAPETPPTPPNLTVERAEEPVKQVERKGPAADRGTRFNYADTFLVPVRDRKTKAVYITEDAHRTLHAIAQSSDGTSLADILGNIVNHHFETYGSDIRAFMVEQEKKNKQRLLI